VSKSDVYDGSVAKSLSSYVLPINSNKYVFY